MNLGSHRRIFSINSGQTSTNLGYVSANHGRCRSILARIKPKLELCWPKLGGFGQIWADFNPNRAASDQFGLLWTEIGLASIRFGLTSAESGGQPWARFDRSLAQLGHRCPQLDQLWLRFVRSGSVSRGAISGRSRLADLTTHRELPPGAATRALWAAWACGRSAPSAREVGLPSIEESGWEVIPEPKALKSLHDEQAKQHFAIACEAPTPPRPEAGGARHGPVDSDRGRPGARQRRSVRPRRLGDGHALSAKHPQSPML